MIDENKICEEARLYVGESWYIDAKQIAYGCFVDGATWAQEEFVSDLWHDGAEEPNPELSAWLVAETGTDSYECFKYGGFNKDGGQTWHNEAEKGHIIRWCYLSDILPKNDNK